MSQQGIPSKEDTGNGILLVIPQMYFWIHPRKGEVGTVISP